MRTGVVYSASCGRDKKRRRKKGINNLQSIVDPNTKREACLFKFLSFSTKVASYPIFIRLGHDFGRSRLAPQRCYIINYST
jgi:hypothetical protein